MITLPKSPVKAETISPTCLTIYGGPKIGKTSIVTALPDYLLLELEPRGAAFLDATKIDLKSLQDLIQVEEAIKANGKPYKFVILDTVDELEMWCEKEAGDIYRARPQGKSFPLTSSVLELERGGGYYWLRNSFYDWFHRVRRLADYTIFIGHVRDKFLINEGKEASSQDLDLTGKVRNILCQYSDATAHCYRDAKGVFTMSFETKDSANCGSRAKHLAGKKFTFGDPATRENWKQIYPDIV